MPFTGHQITQQQFIPTVIPTLVYVLSHLEVQVAKVWPGATPMTNM